MIPSSKIFRVDVLLRTYILYYSIFVKKFHGNQSNLNVIILIRGVIFLVEKYSSISVDDYDIIYPKKL